MKMQISNAQNVFDAAKTAVAALMAVNGIVGGLLMGHAPAANAAMMPAAAAVHAVAAAPQTGAPVALGAFAKIAHRTVGTATVVEGKNGQRALRLTGFETGKGPKLHVYLADAPAVKDNEAAKKLVAGKMTLDLGALKKIKGDQTYALPAGTDLARYRTVLIWCDQFDVTFGAASLN